MMTHQHTEPADLRQQLAAGLLGATSMKLSGVALGLAVVVTLAHMLGPAEFGAYSYVLALVAVLSVPVQSGLPTLVIRETARARQARDWSYMKGLWRWSTVVAGWLALLAGLITLGGLPFFSKWHSGGHLDLLFWGLALIPLIAWNSLRAAALTGLQRVVLGQLPENVLRPGILLALLAGSGIGLSALRPTAESAMALTVLAGLFSLIITAGVLHQHRPAALRNTRPCYRHRSWFAAIWPLALVSGMQLINRHTDILMLGLFVPIEHVGIYRVVAQGAAVVAFSLQIVNMVVAPHFARLHAAGHIGALQRLITGSARLALLTALPVVLVLVLFGDTLLRLVFGNDYAAGYTALSILAIGQLINVGTGSVGLLLNMSGYERQTVRGVAIAASANVPLNLLLIPPMGMSGAALATAISMVVWNVILWRSVQQHLGLNSSPFVLRQRVNSV